MTRYLTGLKRKAATFLLFCSLLVAPTMTFADEVVIVGGHRTFGSYGYVCSDNCQNPLYKLTADKANTLIISTGGGAFQIYLDTALSRGNPKVIVLGVFEDFFNFHSTVANYKVYLNRVVSTLKSRTNAEIVLVGPTKPPYLSYDIAGLNEVVKQVARSQHVRYVSVFDIPNSYSGVAPASTIAMVASRVNNYLVSHELLTFKTINMAPILSLLLND